jgi:hypothetical protein
VAGGEGLMRSRDSFGRFKAQLIQIEPTEEWGYFAGLVIGDGYLFKIEASKDYGAAIESTKRDIVEVFVASALKLGLNPHGIYTRMKKRRFPNGEIRTDTSFRAIIYSKALYDAFKPFKLEDYRFVIPTFLQTKDSKRGFLQGYFDAEASVYTKGIWVGSKHKDNLLQIDRLLEEFGITPIGIYPYRNVWRLVIGKKMLLKYKELIGFRLSRKKEVLCNLTVRR